MKTRFYKPRTTTPEEKAINIAVGKNLKNARINRVVCQYNIDPNGNKNAYYIKKFCTQTEMANALKIAFKAISNEDQNLYQRTSLSFYLFLENKLKLKSGNLDSESVKIILKGKVAPVLIEKAVSILKVCDEANYSSSPMKLDSSIINKMRSLIREIDEVIK